MSPKTIPLSRFPQVCVVEASAGSGKTFALAQRYLRLLINSYLLPEEVPLRTILAITFTNKAAIEMKERILEFLKKIALDSFKSQEEREVILSAFDLDAGPARTKALLIMDSILKNYNFFQVQTIDSFINSILCGCSFKLDLSASFKTQRDYSRYLAYSLDKLIDKAGEDKEIRDLFNDFLKQYLFIENKTGWFPKQNILAIISALYSKSNKYSGVFLRSETSALDLLAIKKEIIKLMQSLESELPEGANKAFAKSLGGFLVGHKDNFDIDSLSDFYKREAFPLNKGNLLPENTAQLWDKVRKLLQELCEWESVCVYNYYVDIFNRVLFDLKVASSKDDVLFLEALNKQAHSLFNEKSLSLPELYWRLACRFRHFLIDEFQDTSMLQWENLFPMVENALAAGGSLFFVGDKKQAIYRFRGGEASLIGKVKERLRDFNLTEDPLSKNYRSHKEIVEFNNEVFSENNLRLFFNKLSELKSSPGQFFPEEQSGVMEVFANSRQTFRQDLPFGFVKSEFLDFQDKEKMEEALKEKVVALVNELSKRFALKEIAILARKNEEVEKLSSWLLEQKIPVESEKTLDIRQNSYIKELISLLKFLNSPIDELSFASFILGDIFARASGISPDQVRDFIFTRQNNKRQGLYLYREFRDKYPGIWDEYFEGFYKSVGFVPLYELTISIFSKFNCLEGFGQYQGFFMRLLELIKDQEDEASGISAFLEFFDAAKPEDLYLAASEADAVKILTIHKAKGLEFPAVVIPYLEINIKSDPGLVVEDNADLRLIYLKKKYAGFSPLLEQLSGREHLLSFLDELNSIYVSFTRAAEELYIFVPAKSDRGANTGALLLPDNDFQQGQKRIPAAPSSRKEPRTLELPVSEYKDWIHLLKDEFVQVGALKAQDKIIKGDVLHCVLANIGNISGQNKEAIVSAALLRAKAEFNFFQYWPEVEEVIYRLMDEPGLKGYFDCPGAQVYTEKEMVNAFGDTLRTDRLIITDKDAVVIDYKSGREKSDQHRVQVERYAGMLREIYPGRKVRGFLLYLDDLTADEIS